MKRNPIHNISWCLNFGKDFLTNSPTPLLDSQILLASSLKVTKEYLYKNPEEKVGGSLYSKYLRFIGMRSKNYPVAYIIKKKEFYGLDFEIIEGVLIPRPETERVVDLAIKKISELKKDLIKIIDLGTGSGCIPISILYNTKNKNIEFSAVDNSMQAIKTAKRNYKKIFQNTKKPNLKIFSLDYECQTIDSSFDIIISNPPYLTAAEITDSKHSSIHFEPQEALSGKTADGLHFYKIISKKWLGKLTPDGIAILEIGTQPISSFMKIFEGFKIKVIKDFAGKNRFLLISRQ